MSIFSQWYTSLAHNVVGIHAFRPPAPLYTWSDRVVAVEHDGRRTPVAVEGSADAPFLIIYSHGNAEDLVGARYRARILAIELDACVVTYDYCGYGPDTGRPSEAACAQDIAAVLEYARETLHYPRSRTVLWGVSLGSGPTLHAAQCLGRGLPVDRLPSWWQTLPYVMTCAPETEHPLAGVVIQCGIASAVSVVSGTLAAITPLDAFRNYAKIGDAGPKGVIVHGTDDDVVPLWHAHCLHGYAEGWPPVIEVDAGHNDVFEVGTAAIVGAVREMLGNIGREES